MLEAVGSGEAARSGETARSGEAALAAAAVRAAGAPALVARGLAVYAGKRALLRGVDLEVAAGTVCAVVGPSGVGKTTLLRCFNRLVDLVAGLRVEGEVAIGGRSVYAPGVDPDRLRARVGMLFQQPVVFPRSISDNVLFGLRRLGGVPRRQWPQRAEAALRQVGLWDQVLDRLREPAGELSVGQQQRLCLARALVLEPVALLMDEPTSALDPESTAAIERLMRRLAGRTTVLLVTHDHGQAARVADRIVRMEWRRSGDGPSDDGQAASGQAGCVAAVCENSPGGSEDPAAPGKALPTSNGHALPRDVVTVRDDGAGATLTRRAARRPARRDDSP